MRFGNSCPVLLRLGQGPQPSDVCNTLRSIGSLTHPCSCERASARTLTGSSQSTHVVCRAQRVNEVLFQQQATIFAVDLLEDPENEGFLTILVPSVLKVRCVMRALSEQRPVDIPTFSKVQSAANVEMLVNKIVYDVDPSHVRVGEHVSPCSKTVDPAHEHHR